MFFCWLIKTRKTLFRLERTGWAEVTNWTLVGCLRTTCGTNSFGIVFSWCTEVSFGTIFHTSAMSGTNFSWWAINAFIYRISSSDRDKLSIGTIFFNAIFTVLVQRTEFGANRLGAALRALVSFLAFIGLIIGINHGCFRTVECRWTWLAARVEQSSTIIKDLVGVHVPQCI